MTLSFADWLIIAVYFVLSAAIGLYYTERAGRSLADYFLSGRSLPWWLAGTSMVATTFGGTWPCRGYSPSSSSRDCGAGPAS